MCIRRHQAFALAPVPMKPVLKPPGSERLKPTSREVLSSFAFKFKLRRYNSGFNIRKPTVDFTPDEYRRLMAGIPTYVTARFTDSSNH